jgi:sulfur carrier protein
MSPDEPFAALRAAIMVRVNGQAQSVSPGTTLAGLLYLLEQEAASVATAVNGEFVPAAQRAARTLADGDRIDCFRQITGG